MEHDQIDENFVEQLEHDQRDQDLKSSTKRFLNYSVMVTALNITFFLLLIRNGMDTPVKIGYALGAYLVGPLIAGFVIGFVIALFPFRKAKYMKKYLRASLIGFIVIQALSFLAIVGRIFSQPTLL